MIQKKEIAGFALGGIGHNLIYALFSGYLLIFYTDVFGLDAAFTGVLFLVARIFDAVNDPIMGIIADRTESRLGKYRVWILRAAPLVAVFLCLCFWAPDLSLRLQYLYCYVTYILLVVSFTCADIPFWSLPSVMTDDDYERTRVFSIGNVAGCLASGIGAVVVPVIGAFATLVSVMTADTIDYAELEMGQRNEGIITSTRTFVTKLATAIAGFGAALMLEVVEYVPNAEQTAFVKGSFHAGMSLVPAVFYLAGFFILFLYPITKDRFDVMQEELAKRRR